MKSCSFSSGVVGGVSPGVLLSGSSLGLYHYHVQLHQVPHKLSQVILAHSVIVMLHLEGDLTEYFKAIKASKVQRQQFRIT